MSQLTTHILDTSKGKPAAGVTVVFFKKDTVYPVTADWRQIAIGTTNNDGRIPDLLNKGVVLDPGMYKLKFETKEYFEAQGSPSFYPYIEIIFTISDNEQYHVPLLLNPFGYSTYRGS
jgi:5-hydroxyisourate hydrolase